MQLQQSIKEKIDIEDNKDTIQYYEYLRNITQITELAYWIGNPSVQIISGRILLEPLKPIKAKKQPQSFELYLKQIQRSNIYFQYQKLQPHFQTKISDYSNESIQEYKSPKKPQSFKIQKIKSKCLILCGIPNSKSPVQVMQTEIIQRNSHLITQIRVIKTVHIKYYGMLLLMKNEEAAYQFFNDVFGSEYNVLEMERIIIREIKQISLSFSELSTEGNNQMMLLRSLKKDNEFIAPQNIFMTYHHQKLKKNSMSKQNYSQLVCAICFEQCSSQAISILCGHYFDLNCLEKWSENICPLCRYHQQPPIIKFCQKCNQCQGLWVCLICGSRLCCGVNNDILSEDSHIYDHFKITGHSLSMELETKFLFDAKIPAFLHKKFYRDLIQNQSQQKIKMQEKDHQNNKKDKITQQIQQYQSQVSEQMKRQRLYFQDQINTSVKSHRHILDKKRMIIQSLRSQIQHCEIQNKQALKTIQLAQSNCQKKQKQLQIIKNLIKIKSVKVQQNKNSFNQFNKKKLVKLKQLESEIREKKQQILNYRKNLKLRQRFSQQLKNQQIQGQIVIVEADKNKHSKKKKTQK